MVLVVRLFVALVGGFFVAQGLSKVDDVVWFFVSGRRVFCVSWVLRGSWCWLNCVGMG